MVEGRRIHVREDVDAVYYFDTEGTDTGGWVLENSANHQKICGPFEDLSEAKQAAVSVPTGGPCHLGDN